LEEQQLVLNCHQNDYQVYDKFLARLKKVAPPSNVELLSPSLYRMEKD
jgi:hypothetical protein